MYILRALVFLFLAQVVLAEQPTQERAHLSYALKLGYIRLQKDSINGATSQRLMITQQKPIVAHDNSLTPQATHRKTVFSAV